MLVPPVIKSSAYMEGLNDSAVLLPCSARGIPRPTISWSKDNTTNSLISSRHQILSNGFLIINDLKLLDAGVYRCEASNEGGTRAVDVILNVHCTTNDFMLSL